MTEQTPKRFERQVAKKLWVAEINQAELLAAADAEPSLLKTARGDVGRVNIMGVVVARDDVPIASVTIDDGSGHVVVRSFDRPIGSSVGSFVQVIGRPREYRGERYIAAEAVVRLDAAWAQYRKRELGGVIARAIEESAATAPAQSTLDESNAEKIVRLIGQLDTGDGADIDDVISMSKLPNAESIVHQLLMHGDIFELRPGKVKVL